MILNIFNIEETVKKSESEEEYAESSEELIATNQFKTYGFNWTTDPFRANIAWSVENVNMLNIGMQSSTGD